MASAVKLPELLVYANIEEETLRELQHKLNDFLKYELLMVVFFSLIVEMATFNWVTNQFHLCMIKQACKRLCSSSTYCMFKVSNGKIMTMECYPRAGSCRKIRVCFSYQRTMFEKRSKPARTI